MVDVKGRWVFITGASRGIGKLMAMELASRGANLILHARKKSNLDEVVSFVESKGGIYKVVEAELSDYVQVNAMLDEICSFGINVDIVYNNAGLQVTYRPDVFDTVAEDYDTSFRINTVAPMMICYRLLPKMLENGFGRIVNTTSGIANEPEQGPYSASKAGLDKVTADLTKITRAKKDADVLVFLTDPGWCRTDLGGPNAPNSPESAVNGMVAPGLAEAGSKDGYVVHAQDYAGKTIEEIVSILKNA